MALNSEEIILCQKNLAEEIARLTRNFKKDGKERKTEEYLEKKLKDLEKYWSDFVSLHKTLEQSIDKEHPYFSENLYEKTHDIYINAVELIANYRNINVPDSKQPQIEATGTHTPDIAATLSHEQREAISQIINQHRHTNPSTFAANLTQPMPTQNVVIPQQSTNNNPYLEASRINNYPKLPPIKIPKFTGEYKDWKTFIDIFINVIDNNIYLTEVEKMQYLLYHLEGDARRVIGHLQLTSSNYKTALNLIQARYNNNRKIITTYINTILDAKKTEHRSQEDIIVFYDLIRECLEALKNLSCNTAEWGPMIVCLAIRKLDTESLRLFEESLSDPREMPTVEELLKFLEKRHQVLDCLQNSKQQKVESSSKNSKRSFHTIVKRLCIICSKPHNIYQCGEFKKMNVTERTTLIMRKKLCPNCLVHSNIEKCKSTKSCVFCKKHHHSLLHRNNDKAIESQEKVSTINESKALANMTTNLCTDTKKPIQSGHTISFHTKDKGSPHVLLPTALVRIKNAFGQTEQFRALIDPASQVSLITEETVQILKVNKQRINATILGVGETKSAQACSKVTIKLQLKQHNLWLTVEALVLPKLNSYLPESPIIDIDRNKFNNITLADPDFDKPGPIDLLLGADVYGNIITNGTKQGQPAAQNTKLGWILFGAIPNAFTKSNKLATFLSLAEIEERLERFWEIKDIPTTNEQDETCEEDFVNTHKRDADGRYIVQLPFKQNAGQLRKSRNTALARLLQVEKKLKKNSEQRTEYNKFLTEYLALGHMSLAKQYKGNDALVYYLPHHAVFKGDSTTTKLRVVFDASCKSESGLSLNDLLHTGPKIQQNLNEILLRWRKHRYVYTADIEKMFRQIKIADNHKNFQRILWRQHEDGPIQEFVLNTVTYGTGPATYLSVRVLQQLSKDEGKSFPLGKKILSSDFYVDDMLTGADTKLEARKLQKEIVALLKRGGFNLRKWTCNNEELLKDIPEEIREKGILEIDANETIKTLGIHWNPKRDEFHYKLKIGQHDDSVSTKRMLLSKIASIFDPLGLLAPVTITAKLIMQSLWTAQIKWDEKLPTGILTAWEKIESELQDLQAIKIPRWINYRASHEIQLHGFCDASEKGYAAAVYTRVTDSFGKVHTQLLVAKTKVAPLKQKITIPRLELCGALLLARLLKDTITTMEIKAASLYAWCDSEIVLAWLAKNPNSMHMFVANRVSEIQRLFPTTIWRHVSSQDNPADVASRGISPRKLITHNIWWKGPLWLSRTSDAWPTQRFNIETDMEAKKVVQVLNTITCSSELFTHSTLTRQIRVIAYCRRFFNNCRTSKSQRNILYLTSEELLEARHCIIKITQQEAFNDEIRTLSRNKPLKKSSKVLALHPFLDTKGILRVGGRLRNSNLPENAKHQILLPQKHHVTNLIIDHAHQQTLHGGSQLTLNFIREQYWIINAKNVVQSRIHRCIKCLRYRQNPRNQLMGDLPAMRINPSPPFSHCGVDYAGPFLTKMSKGRGVRTLKGYIALFICMVTKAVHLELVSDLTTNAFLAAYKRFVSRRGNCKQIYSDNGTNFVGAHNKLDKDMQQAINEATKQAAEKIANDGTTWKFIPAASPHFGGLWEAGVKSVKGHLKRVLGETLLTYEEFTTVLHQVEACLNSRPIGQMSADPHDLEPLTPGHFLIGRPLVAPPEPNVVDESIYQRWKLVSKLYQDIWKRWSKEYLSSLQQRSKWKTEGKNPNIGELVLVKDDTLPPQKWSLGRIEQLHPGDDGIVRIVSVKYRNDIKKRPINKLCQLPVNILNTGDSESEPSYTTALNIVTKPKPISRKRKRADTRNHDEEELWSKPEHFHQIKKVIRQRPPVKRSKTKIAPCTWAANILKTTIFLLYWLTIVFAQGYEVLHPESGFYVENLGDTHVKRGNLRLQITFSESEIVNDQTMINTTWLQIRDICAKTKQLTDITHCDTLLRHLTIRQQNLLQITDEIAQLVQERRRKKRGLLGSLLTSVFGVNDEIYTEIHHLQEDQQTLLRLSNQQTLFLNSKINQTSFAVEEKLKQYDLRLVQVINSINEMSTWYSKADHNRIGIEIISTYLSAEDFYDELQEKYNRWLSAVHEHGHLLDFLSAYEIGNIINEASKRLGSNLFIQKTPQKRLDITTSNSTLNLYGYLNIVETNKYELIHVTPIPHMIGNNSFTIIDLKYATLAVNFDSQTYFVLDDQELKACSTTRPHIYLCTPKIVHNIDDNPSCVIDHIYERHSKLNCKVQQVQLTGTVWKALMRKNTWLYITTQPKIVAIICKGVRKELFLNTTGIIHLEDECFIKTKEATLKTTIDESIDVVTSHIKETIPELNQIKFNATPSHIQAGVLIRPGEHFLDYRLSPDPPSSNILHRTLTIHSISSSVAVIIIIFVAILLHNLWKRYKRPHKLPRHNKERSTPIRRRYSAPEISQYFDRVLASVGRQHVHTEQH